MSKSLIDQEKNLGRGGHWTKGANVTRDGHQIEKFILDKIKKKNGIGVPKVSWGKDRPLRTRGSVPGVKCF